MLSSEHSMDQSGDVTVNGERCVSVHEEEHEYQLCRKNEQHYS